MADSDLDGQPEQPGPDASEPPSISLPKGGGAIRGIGEKFAANPVTGTGSMSVPIATSPGRSGFGAQLSLSYDSGAGNGPFGFGWSLSLPAITRKTDKGLPKYHDAEESDLFLLSGAEDLVPLLNQDASRFEDNTTDPDYVIHRYRPRIEGLFARIERWTRQTDGDVHWRSISGDNILTIFGKDAESRIIDPEDPQHIFSWLICESRDDRGNAVLYQYKPEDGAGVDVGRAHERNRGGVTDPRRTANRYLKRIRYGNRLSLLSDTSQRPRFLHDIQRLDAGWMFEVVFDYGEHDAASPKPDDSGQWHFRADPFSNYRSGFEVRTTRLCRRVLMFHHFDGEEGVGNDCLVRSTDFSYSHQQNPDDVRDPIYTFLEAVSQSGYKRKDSGYLKRSLPPVEFEYTQPVVQDTVEKVAPASLENLPIGVDGAAYRWTDLHGEGIPGILTEQASTWFYKRNLSPNSEQPVEFAPQEQVAAKPNLALAAGAQFMDLAGDGQLDMVVLDDPMPGFYAHDADEGWQPHRPFQSRLNRDTRDPNLRFIDLDGDGHADVLISEDDAFVWHASLAEQGFGPARRVARALDEEQGPRLVFADGTQSIYLADLSGDGLTDLVRIRNGEVSYWPNLGYARFGTRISMDNAPLFDQPDQFDHGRIRVADVDGSGTIDILYLHRDGVRLYFNQSGNRWSEPQVLSVFPRIDDLVSIDVTDLLGNGTACLVWSSPLSGDARQPMRYVNLMGGQKPHLLVRTINNLGAETQVQYAPSTKFYLQDKRAGKPWITKLPFPVHLVEKVIVTDKWRETRFATSYSYHHGYFDGVEREFRGFGRVEQVDVESYGEFKKGNAGSPFITDDRTLYQPPVKTVTWYHTGVAIDREHILSQYEAEYFPNWFEAQNPDQTNVLGDFRENALPPPDLQPPDLTTDEWREAMRACKGMPLRQEVYELDVDALEQGEQRPVKLFSAAYHNCQIRRLQPKADNSHAVFLVTESEAISYQYELDLRGDSLNPNPRIAHSLNLNIDQYGNVLQAVAAVYPRLQHHQDASLPPGAEALIAQVQTETHLSYTETRYTNDVDDPSDLDNYRLRVPCEVKTYELTGIGPEDNDDRASADPSDNLYFSIDELRHFQLSPQHQTSGEPVPEIDYHRIADRTTAQKRRVEQVRMLFFHQNLREPLPFGQLNALGLPFETYTLALTGQLLTEVFGSKLTNGLREQLDDADQSGYLSGPELAARFPDAGGGEGQYWIRSGIAGFADDAAQHLHFFLPKLYTDPFGSLTTLEYDVRDLFVRSSTDAVENHVQVEKFDYRVLAPRELKDINDNLSEVIFDTLGLPTAVAVKGKGDEADSLAGFDDELLNPELARRIGFFADTFDPDQARSLLGNATARHVYDFGEVQGADGSISYGHRPAGAAGILRERHVARPATDAAGSPLRSPLQVAFEYSDGSGNVLVTKAQAEPENTGGPLRWIANGKTILNNKGNPVKQYEPYFCEIETALGIRVPDHRFEEPIEQGVTPIIYYDAAGRTIRTEAPDGSYSRFEFSPWHVTSYDPNDTAFDADPENLSDWYQRRSNPAHDRFEDFDSPENRRAASLVEDHANTPATVFLDSLGREVISIEHNRFKDATQTLQDEKYLTYTKLDTEGKPLWIRDARGNLVMQYIMPNKPLRAADEPDPSDPEAIPEETVTCYDIAGNLLCQHSMDGGDRWMITDAAGQPFLAWDENENIAGVLEQRLYHSVYDELRRPLEQQLRIDDGPAQVIERFVYGEQETDAKARNLRGQPFQHYDSSGLITSQAFDFKSNPLEVTRRLASDFEASVIHWPENPATSAFEPDTYTQTTEYDALDRMTGQQNWHIQGRPPAIYTPQYNQRGLLVSEKLQANNQTTEAILNIEHDAKGQRTRIEYGNGTTTRYIHDPETFRLVQLRTTLSSPGDSLPVAPSNLSNPNVLQNLYYSYDPVGNITEILDDAYEPVFFRNQQVEAHSTYTYDALYRLIAATGRENFHALNAPRAGKRPDVQAQTFPIADQVLRNYAQHYQYDSVGNIERMTHVAAQGSWTRHYAYADDSNRLLRTWLGSITDDSNAIVYQYDRHGSMLNLNRTPDEYRLHWDPNDMIHHIKLDADSGEAFYQYSADKERSCKRILRNGRVVEERIYLGGMERFRKFDANGLIKEEIETHHLFDGEQRVLMVEDVLTTDSGTLDRGILFKYQYSNHLGSVGLEADEDGAIISYEEYHPYGTTAYSANGAGVRTTRKRYCYTRMEPDEESGLSYHSARYYLPWLGRWLSSDPIGIGDGINIYAYVRNNPIRLADLTGTDSAGISIVETMLKLAVADIITPTPDDAIPLKWIVLGGVVIVAGGIVLIPKGAEIIEEMFPKKPEHMTPEIEWRFKQMEKEIPQLLEPVNLLPKKDLIPKPPVTDLPPLEVPDSKSKPRNKPDEKKRRRKKRVHGHHIASDKSAKYAPKFMKIFSKANAKGARKNKRLTLDSPENVRPVIGHKGPHGDEYHEIVLGALEKAVSDEVEYSAGYKKALIHALDELYIEINIPGTRLYKLARTSTFGKGDDLTRANPSEWEKLIEEALYDEPTVHLKSGIFHE